MFRSVVAIYRDIERVRYKNKHFQVTFLKYFAIRMTVLPILQAVVCSGRLAERCPAGAREVILCLLGLFLTFSKKTLNLFHFPMFYLNLSEMMEHGKRPPYFVADPPFKSPGSNRIA